MSRHYYDNRAITTPTTTRMATQASASRLRASARSRAFDGCDARHNPAAGTPNPVIGRSCDAHLSHRRASPCRPGREPRHQEGLPTRQASGGACRPTRTPKETAAQLEGPGRRKLSNHPHSSSTTERRNVAAVAHQGRRTYCGCTPDAANRVSNMAMAPCDNPAETCANQSLITSCSPPWKIMAHRLEGRDPGRCGWGALTGRGLVSRADQT